MYHSLSDQCSRKRFSTFAKIWVCKQTSVLLASGAEKLVPHWSEIGIHKDRYTMSEWTTEHPGYKMELSCDSVECQHCGFVCTTYKKGQKSTCQSMYLFYPNVPFWCPFSSTRVFGVYRREAIPIDDYLHYGKTLSGEVLLLFQKPIIFSCLSCI